METVNERARRGRLLAAHESLYRCLPRVGWGCVLGLWGVVVSKRKTKSKPAPHELPNDFRRRHVLRVLTEEGWPDVLVTGIGRGSVKRGHSWALPVDDDDLWHSPGLYGVMDRLRGQMREEAIRLIAFNQMHAESYRRDVARLTQCAIDAEAEIEALRNLPEPAEEATS